MMHGVMNSDIFILCKDENSKGGVFDALTDEFYQLELEDWKAPTFEEAADKSMAYMHRMLKECQLDSAGGTKK